MTLPLGEKGEGSKIAVGSGGCGVVGGGGGAKSEYSSEKRISEGEEVPQASQLPHSGGKGSLELATRRACASGIVKEAG